jgi:hypothetical protein
MCKFCSEESEWILNTEYDRNVRADIGILQDESVLCLYIRQFDGLRTDNKWWYKQPINFCPMCGEQIKYNK